MIGKVALRVTMIITARFMSSGCRSRVEPLRSEGFFKRISHSYYMGGCQNYGGPGPFLGTLNIRCRIILRTQKGTLF